MVAFRDFIFNHNCVKGHIRTLQISDATPGVVEWMHPLV